VTVVVLGVLGELLFKLAEAGTSAATVAGLGVLLAVGAAILALAVSGQRGVLVPLVAVVVIVGGVAAPWVLGAQDPEALALVDAVVLVLVVGWWSWPGVRPQSIDRAVTAFWDAMARPETRQVAAGLLFGLACTARLTIVFGFPFLLLVGGSRQLAASRAAGRRRSGRSRLVALLVYTYAETGHLFTPCTTTCTSRRSSRTRFLNYHADWSIEDLRYVPQNLMIMLFNTPIFSPETLPYRSDQLCQLGQARGIFDVNCRLRSRTRSATASS